MNGMHKLAHENWSLQTRLNDLERENMILKSFVVGAILTAIGGVLWGYWT